MLENIGGCTKRAACSVMRRLTVPSNVLATSCVVEPRSTSHSESTLVVSKSRVLPSRELGTSNAWGMHGLCVLVSHRDWRAAGLAFSWRLKLKLSTLKHVERRLLREYLDLPGLSLTLAQAARLVCVDAPTCEVVLNDLVNAHCLTHNESGTYVQESRYGDLERWKGLVRNRLTAATQASPSPTKAVRSVRPQMVDGTSRTGARGHNHSVRTASTLECWRT